MPHPIKTYFRFARTERRGIVVLWGVLCAVLLFYTIIPYIAPAKKIPADELRAVEAWQASLTRDNAPYGSYGNRQSNETADNAAARPATLFAFDPNTATEADFVQLGVTPRVAATIIKYRSRGGKFRKPDDLQKIYTLPPADYARLAPYIRIGEANGYNNAAHSNGNAFAATPADKPAAILAPFDPNTATEADFLRLGLPERTAKSILNYRDKGGKFRSREDFKKIYTLTPDDYTRLEPYINVAAASATATSPTLTAGNNTKLKPFVKIDINSASVDDWQKLNGIGIGYASRIVRFRDALGGFTNIKQVAETRGLPDSVYQRIEPLLLFSAENSAGANGSHIKKLRINTATLEEMRVHPYIGGLAKVIVSFREQHGRFKTVDELRQIKIITPEVFRKMQPYLTSE